MTATEEIRVRYTIEASSLEAIDKKAKEVQEAVEVLHQKVAELKELKLGLDMKSTTQS